MIEQCLILFFCVLLIYQILLGNRVIEGMEADSNTVYMSQNDYSKLDNSLTDLEKEVADLSNNMLELQQKAIACNAKQTFTAAINDSLQGTSSSSS